jgi:hypothetical protein
MAKKNKTNIIKNQARQGDVYIVRVDNIDTSNKRTDPRVVFAYGEVTGHCHELQGVDENVDAYGITEVDRVAVRDLIKEVTHQEHGTVVLTPGTYDVVRQWEYSPSRDMQRVAD